MFRFKAEVKPKLGIWPQLHPSFTTCSCKVTYINPPVSTPPLALELPERYASEAELEEPWPVKEICCKLLSTAWFTHMIWP